MRSHDWAGTPLGPVEQWPQSLRTSVSTCLNCAFPILVWWGPELVMLYNDEYRAILGTQKHPRALGTPGRQVWAEIWDVIGPMLDQVIRKGEATRSRDLLLEMDRHGYLEETYFSFSYSPIRDERGNVGGVFCPVIETTDRVLGERRLRTLSELSAAAASAESKSLAETQALCLDVLESNRADVPFALLYTREPDDIARLERSTGLASGGPYAPARVSLTDSPWRFDAVFRGEACDFELAGEDVASSRWGDPVRTAVVQPVPRRDQGDVTSALVLGVNPRRALDDDYRTFLERIAGAIATAFANARAFEAERQRAETLAELDRAKTAFFSNVSHEFRTPLTLMLGPLEDALAAGDPAGGRERLELAHRNALRLLKLVNSLLDFSRIESGRAQANFEPVDIATLTADLASNFRSACERAGLRFTVDCSPVNEPVYVDRDMWEKIVLNLLSNAFKFTFDGEIGIRLRAAAGHVELTVSDTGVGLPEHEMPRLFERFHRIEGQQSRTHEGSGIGLALVQELVKLHGGEIGATSAQNKGTRFVVTIPTGSSHLPQDKVSAQPHLSPTSVRPDAYVQEALRWLPDAATAERNAIAIDSSHLSVRAGTHILVADDNADMRSYVAGLLGPSCQVETVADGEAALQAIRQRRPDLVLADVMMPRLNGFELLRAIRSDPELRGLPVIMLSARAGEESRVEGLDAGADDYLVKPFSSRELIARVAGALELARIRQDAMAAIRESERRVRELFRQAPGFVAVLRGPEHVFEFANDAYLGLIGRRDILGRTVRQALPEMEGQGFLEILDRVYASGEPYTGFETPVLLRRAGDEHLERRYLSFVYQPIKDAGGATGIFIEGFDTTERKRAEDALRRLTARTEQLRRLYEAILTNTPDLAYVFDLDHRFIYANDVLLKMWGKTRSEAIGKNCLELGYEPWHAAMHDREIDQVIATQQPVRGQVPFTGTFGRRIYDYIFVPVIGPDGQVEAVAGTTRDITDRVENEEALRASEERFRTLATASFDAVYRMSADWSEMRRLDGKRFIDDTHQPSRAWMGKYILAEDQPALWEAIEHAIRTKGIFELEHRVLRSDGTVGWTYSRAVPLLDAEGRIVEWFGAASDVTARKDHEQRQKLLLDELNHRVKNTLAIVQSFATQSLRNTGSIAKGREAFEARLIALARAHDVLTRENWEGAGLREVVAEALSPYLGASPARVTIDGPDLRLSPRAALAFAMALHELATNAAKYGALSNDLGRVQVTWEAAGGDLRMLNFRWAERGGPEVRKPDRRGFGSRLIERGLSQDLGGEVRLDFDRSGLTCVIRASLAELSGANARRRALGLNAAVAQLQSGVDTASA